VKAVKPPIFEPSQTAIVIWTAFHSDLSGAQSADKTMDAVQAAKKQQRLYFDALCETEG
jgi:ABC-type glycerol-3-phosphate transport system substrate-binding protein